MTPPPNTLINNLFYHLNNNFFLPHNNITPHRHKTLPHYRKPTHLDNNRPINNNSMPHLHADYRQCSASLLSRPSNSGNVTSLLLNISGGRGGGGNVVATYAPWPLLELFSVPMNDSPAYLPPHWIATPRDPRYIRGPHLTIYKAPEQ
ncbi:hypothetical protein Pcinc_009315 [Petrolisthes cinctipes]|uniref:Uncharacterized protein n=1 Tax=Petrolisthes cinctipes TaxID=88211 RepID=A0AAE1G784_PETCI|nr:hypothetical protein Pcinc_009315 [Petrolisthes cinctipes]